MPVLSRADISVLGRWWWTVDRWTLLAIGVLIGCGYVMMLAASPAVAERIGQARSVFILKQIVFLALAGLIVVAVSLLTPRGVLRVAAAGCALALALTALTLVAGVQIKGAQRWIALPGFSLQPSEFLKPCFAVVAAWLIAEGRRTRRFPGMLAACAVFAVIAVLLKSQPDIGMLAVITGVLFAQLFVGGLNVIVTGLLAALIGGGGFAAYLLFPHVQSRVARFLHPGVGDNYQVNRAMEAFGAGGLLGRGPGEGHVKDVLPDAHADFVFAVMGEEFGMVVCLLILGVFGFIVMRGLARLLVEDDLFVVLAATGLIASFGLQAFVNMASTLQLIPTKGMTLPFISYGGSSVVAVAFGVGLLLALTRPARGRRGLVRGPMARPVVIAAGGTGGHFFPAEALAAELARRGQRVALMTDARSGALDSPAFAGRERFVLRGAGIAGRGMVRGARAAAALAAGTIQARGALGRLHASALVGFGGYPSVAPVLATRLLRNRPPVLLHEQNAVLGRANRMLCRHASRLALSFAATARLPQVRHSVTGNPVRPAIAAIAGAPYAAPEEHVALLVLGGSLGARVFSDVVPGALATLPAALRVRLRVTQQCRAEDIERVRAAYASSGIAADLAVFFADMAGLLASAHLVIARAGASTVAELAAVGRPSILVPLPHAIDDHQTANATALADAGGAWVLAQPAFTQGALALRLERLLSDAALLRAAAARAATCGHAGAAARLADLVEAAIAEHAREFAA